MTTTALCRCTLLCLVVLVIGLGGCSYVPAGWIDTEHRLVAAAAALRWV